MTRCAVHKSVDQPWCLAPCRSVRLPGVAVACCDRRGVRPGCGLAASASGLDWAWRRQRYKRDARTRRGYGRCPAPGSPCASKARAATTAPIPVQQHCQGGLMSFWTRTFCPLGYNEFAGLNKAELLEALRRLEVLRICPACGGEGGTLLEQGERESFRCRCRECKCSWGLRVCDRCGQRYPFLLLGVRVVPSEPTASWVGWVDRCFWSRCHGGPVPAIPTNRLHLSTLRCLQCLASRERADCQRFGTLRTASWDD